MLSSFDVGSLLERAHAAKCEVTVEANGEIAIRPRQNVPPDLLSEITKYKFAVLQRLYDTHYRAYYWLDKEPKQRELLREARRRGCAVTVKTLDGETTDLEVAGAVGGYVRPGTLGIPDDLVPTLEAAGFMRVEYPEHRRWAMSWHQAVSNWVERWRSTHSPAEQLAVWLAADVANVVANRGLEPWEEVRKTYEGIKKNLPTYGRERALKPVLRRWLEANAQRDRLRARNRWIEPQQTDYYGLRLTPEAEAVNLECERWAWLVMATERIAGRWPWIDPSGWLGILKQLVEEAAT